MTDLRRRVARIVARIDPDSPASLSAELRRIETTPTYVATLDGAQARFTMRGWPDEGVWLIGARALMEAGHAVSIDDMDRITVHRVTD